MVDKTQKFPLASSLDVDDRQYTISKLVIDQKSPLKNFHLLISPENEAARRAELAVGPAHVTLVDDGGDSYVFLGTRTRWSRDSEAHRVAWQQLMFKGAPSAGAMQLNLTVEGVGEVTGPFIFRGVPLP